MKFEPFPSNALCFSLTTIVSHLDLHSIVNIHLYRAVRLHVDSQVLVVLGEDEGKNEGGGDVGLTVGRDLV